MQVRTFGSQQGDSQKTLTLRQFHVQHGSTPRISYVNRIFKPNKTNSFALITDANFRVNVYETSPLYAVLLAEAEQWVNEDVALFVQVDDGAKGHWTLGANDELKSVWEDNAYGWNVREGELALKRRKTVASGKKGRTSTTERSQEG